MAAFSCPRVDELKAFALGDLGDDSFARVAAHIGGCHDCEALLQAFDNHADVLLTGLRDLQPGTDVAAPPQELVTAARRAAQFSPGGLSSEISMDSGRRFSKQLQAGACRL